jgi:archaellum biogenesis protein FlaJ (TadC family)
MDKRLMTITLMTAVIVALILIVNFIYFRDNTSVFSSVIIVCIIMLVLPITLVRYYEMVKIKATEEHFPQFIRDLVESIRSGMTLPQAVESISKNDYGGLSPLVNRLNAQLNWGIPFDQAFLKFSRSTKSKLIGRTTLTIIESHRFGGNLTDIFAAVSATSLEIERLREERKLYINSQLMTGYVIFFVFLIVIIGLQKFLIPMLTDISTQKSLTGADLGVTDMASQYRSIFRNLIILQGFFAGLVIGKMSEGQIAGGIKHSLFLIIVGIIIYSMSGFI